MKKRLNLGCGDTKLDGYVNIDCEKSVEPDLVHNFIERTLPYRDKSVDEVVLFHTIEHIQAKFHLNIFKECFRVLRVKGEFILSYPDFWDCAMLWKNNTAGQRDFWEKTIFGRQLYPSDFHVCAMDPGKLKLQLISVGFESVVTKSEPKEKFNRITRAVRGEVAGALEYEDLVRREMQLVKFA